ncbi:cellulase family glycosylhydrolase [Williamsia deligens]|uniref:Cellulase family glycosylhydrolase n=1 Tax=Williamsia deligens TaxID=321325 RepID=A0ABW3G3K7_9NOCA
MRSALLLLVAILLLVPACSAGRPPAPDESPSPRPAVWSRDTMSLSLPGLEELGARTDEQLDFAAAQGFTAIRVPVRWSEIEREQGQFDWGPLDKTIRSAAARQLQILAVVTWAPAWAVDPYQRSYSHPAPQSAAEFARFAGQAAARYRGLVSAWEVWNEPNIAVNFGPVPDVNRYCDILRRSHTAIKAAAPSALVITGGTSPAADTSSSVSPANFVNALYTCAPNSFDAVAMHPYPGNTLLGRQTGPNTSTGQIAQVNEVMKYRGDTRRKVWFTEFGSNTGTPPTGVSDEQQAQVLYTGVSLLRQLDFAGPTFVFTLRDIDTGSAVPDYNYGLVRSNFSVKPSLRAVLAAYRR